MSIKDLIIVVDEDSSPPPSPASIRKDHYDTSLIMASKSNFDDSIDSFASQRSSKSDRRRRTRKRGNNKKSSNKLNKNKKVQQYQLGDDGTTLRREITPEDIFFALINGEEIGGSAVVHHQSSLALSKSSIDPLNDDIVITEEVDYCNDEDYEEVSEIDYNDTFPVREEEGEEEKEEITSITNVTTDVTTTATSSRPPKPHSSRKSSSSSTATPSVFFQFANQVRTRHELNIKAMKFREFVDVRHRTHNLKLYRNCFVGSEAVSAMIYNGMVETREQGVNLGRQMAKDLGLFRHVKGWYLFQDSDDYFYQFRYGNGGTTSTSNSVASQQGDFDELTFGTGLSSCDTHSITPSSDDIIVGDITEGCCGRLQQMAKAFRECVDVKDRRYRLKTYKNCFVGSEAVDMLVSTRIANSRSEAVEFGRTLARELNLFSHVTEDHAFCDKNLFFRFNDSGIKPNKRVLPIVLATL